MKNFLLGILIGLLVSLATAGVVYAVAFGVFQGGTGNTSFPVDAIITGGSTATGPLKGTSSQPLYVGSITSTTTATSTFSGGINMTGGGGLRLAGGAITSVSNSTSTFASGIRLTSGCFADLDGNCVVGGGITGSGAANQLTYWTSSSATAGDADFTVDAALGQLTSTALIFTNATGTDATTTSLSVFANARFGGSATSSFNSAGVLTLITPLADASVANDITLTNITQITNRAIADTSGTLTVARGGTNLTTFAAGDVVYASALDTLAGLTAGASSTVFTVNASGLPVWTAQPSFATLATRGLFSAFGNVTGTSTFNWSAGLFRIVASSTLTTLTSGEMGIDTTSGQLRFNDGNTTMVVVATSTFGTNLSSTTLANYGGFGGVSATATVIVPGLWDDVTITEITCQSKSTTTVPNAILEIGDGTASATPIAFCNNVGQVISLSANNTFTPGEDIYLGFGSATGTVPDKIFPRINYKFDSN